MALRPMVGLWAQQYVSRQSGNCKALSFPVSGETTTPVRFDGKLWEMKLLPHYARAVVLGQLHNGAIFQILNIRIPSVATDRIASASLILAASTVSGSLPKILLIRADA